MTTTSATPLHIIEPTLNSDAGHCMSLVRALSDAAKQTGCKDIQIWGGRKMSRLTWTAPGNVHAHFERRWRRFQALGLYRKLLRKPGHILVSTAGSADLVSLDWAARSCGLGRIPANKVSLFVHWLNIKPGKAKLYAAIARRQPELKILTPTTSVAAFFQSCGFRTQVVPYPLDTGAPETQPAVDIRKFRHLLVPGSARMDKGFDHIVDMIEEMAKRQFDWPIVVQTSLEHGHDKDLELTGALKRLQACKYQGLQQLQDSMSKEAYRELFLGAIVIQPYRASSFQDRVSGVTLDALQAGAPIVVTDGTWMAQLVQKYKAGIATSDLTPNGLLNAIQSILNDHSGFTQRAGAAAIDVRAEHSARALIEAALTGT